MNKRSHDFELQQHIDELGADPEFVAEGLSVRFVEEALRILRERGLSQSWLAEKMGVSRAHVSKIFKAPPNLTLRTLAKIAIALDLRASAELTSQGDHGDEKSEIRRLEEGEAWEDSDEPVRLEAKRPGDKVVPILLSAEHWAELRKAAAGTGSGPTTLARMWILETLRSKRPAQASPEYVGTVKEASADYKPSKVPTDKQASGKRGKK